MKIHFYICLIISFSLLVACEKDDICAETTTTTPQLVITFKDANNINESKAVESLAVYAIENNELILIETINGINTDSIAIPLKNDIGISNFKFYKNYSIIDEIIEGEENHIYLEYNAVEVFVSRACGFKTNFTLDSTLPFIKTETSIPDGYWIQNVVINTSNISTENEIHAKIYF